MNFILQWTLSTLSKLRALEQVNKFITLHLCPFIRTFNLHFLPFNQVPFLFFNRHETSFELNRTNENSERYFVFLSRCKLGWQFRFRFRKEIGPQKQRSERVNRGLFRKLIEKKFTLIPVSLNSLTNLILSSNNPSPGLITYAIVPSALPPFSTSANILSILILAPIQGVPPAIAFLPSFEESLTPAAPAKKAPTKASYRPPAPIDSTPTRDSSISSPVEGSFSELGFLNLVLLVSVLLGRW